jgi:predicted O-methyltransferase YrrM
MTAPTVSRQWTLALEADYAARLAAWSDIQGHLPYLYAEAASRPGCRVLELGTRSGTSTAAFLLAAARVGGHVWSVDVEEPRVPSWWPLTGLWTFTRGDDLHPAVAAAQPADVDVLLIDTSHTRLQTLAELSLYVPRVKTGGVVCCHDTDLAGHDQAGFGIEGPGSGVRAALDEWCAATGRTWRNRPGSYGMGVITIRGDEHGSA